MSDRPEQKPKGKPDRPVGYVVPPVRKRMTRPLHSRRGGYEAITPREASGMSMIIRTLYQI